MWSCSLCSERNEALAVTCRNCGNDAPANVKRAHETGRGATPAPSPAAPSPASPIRDGAAVPDPNSDGDLADFPVPPTPAPVPSEALWVNPTGTVSVSERAISGRGGGGGAAAVQMMENEKALLHFRLMVEPGPNSAGRPQQLAVQWNVSNKDMFALDGDVVTLLGKFKPGAVVHDPHVVNETGQVYCEGRETSPDWGHRGALIRLGTTLFLSALGLWIAWDLRELFWALAFGFSAIAVLALPKYWALLPLAVFAVAMDGLTVHKGVVLLGLAGVALSRPPRARPPCRADVLARWPATVFKDPLIVVEGVTNFVRERTPQTMFRGAVYDAAGNLAGRLTWIARQRDVPGQLRRGDTLKVPGEWRVGEIHRVHEVELR